MPTADELLRQISDEEKVLVIDNDLRTINIPPSIKLLGVESDDGVLTTNFRMPRFYCGIDLSTFRIRINILNAAGEGDYADAEDVVVNADNIEFSWEIGRHTAYTAGNVRFNVCLKLTNGNGDVLKEYNTTRASLPILQGLEVDDQVILQYNDILEQWRAQLFGGGDTVMANIEAMAAATIAEVEAEMEAKVQEAIDSIPEDFTATYNMADEALRKKADAVILGEMGERIRLDDSSDNGLISLNVYGKSTQKTTSGKNLIPYPHDQTSHSVNGITFTDNGDGTVTLNGTCTSYASYVLAYETNQTAQEIISAVKGTTFTISGNIGTGVQLTVQKYNTDKTADEYRVVDSGSGATYTDSGNDGSWKVFIAVMNGTVCSNRVIKPILELGSTASEYEEYSAGVASPSPAFPQEINSVVDPTIRVVNRNLANLLTYTANVNYGTLIKAADFAPIQRGKTYTLSVYLTASEASKAYWNSAVKNIPYREFDVSAGTNRYSITFVANSDGVLYDSAIDVLNKYPSGDDVAIQATDAQLEENAQTDYVPYYDGSVSVDYELNAIPVSTGGTYTDANGQQWIADEIDFERGKLIRRVKDITLTDLNSSRWNTWGVDYHQGGYTGFYYYMNDPMPHTEVLCNIVPFSVASWGGRGNGASAAIDYFQVSVSNDYLRDVSTDELALTSFKALIADTNAKILLSRPPIETDLTTSQIQAFRALHTHATDSTILNNSNAMMKVRYNADLQRWLYKNIDWKKRMFDITLEYSKWSEAADKSYYYQVVDCIAKPNSVVDLHPTLQQLIAIINDGYSMFLSNENGVVTAYAIGGHPASDFTVTATEQVVIYE